MLERYATWAAAAALGAVTARAADVVYLKDKATITGTILTEKKDMVVVDLGYTVLTIPRNQVASIGRETVAPPKGKHSGRATEKPSRADQVPVPPPLSGGELFQTARVPRAERTVRELVQELGEGVVQVRTPGGLGSGFFLNEDGHLITNFHVIEGETQIAVEVYLYRDGQLERKTFKQVKIVAMNKFADLALLKIEDADAARFKAVALGDFDALAVGERVFAIGSPQGLERTVTEGIVSTKTRQMEGALYLQTTTQINPGNSGGPLFNLRGEVVGVTNMKRLFSEGLGFAIPVDQVKYFLRHRDAYAYDNDNPNNAYRYLQPPSRLQLRKDGAEGGDAK